jgi:hypothetical protein
LGEYFNKGGWRDKTILASDVTKINKIRIQKAKDQFSVEKKDGQWVAQVNGKEVKLNQEKVDEIVALMANMAAAEIPEQKFDGTDLDKNLLIIQASGEGIDNTLMVGKSNGQDMYFVKSSKSDNIYLIPTAVKEKLDTNIKNLQ